MSAVIVRAAGVTLKVYDALGRLVRVLVDEPMDAGRYCTRWDGRNEHGQRVASGVYLYRMEAAGFEATKKMLVAR